MYELDYWGRLFMLPHPMEHAKDKNKYFFSGVPYRQKHLTTVFDNCWPVSSICEMCINKKIPGLNISHCPNSKGPAQIKLPARQVDFGNVFI